MHARPSVLWTDAPPAPLRPLRRLLLRAARALATLGGTQVCDDRRCGQGRGERRRRRRRRRWLRGRRCRGACVLAVRVPSRARALREHDRRAPVPLLRLHRRPLAPVRRASGRFERRQGDAPWGDRVARGQDTAPLGASVGGRVHPRHAAQVWADWLARDHAQGRFARDDLDPPSNGGRRHQR